MNRLSVVQHFKTSLLITVFLLSAFVVPVPYTFATDDAPALKPVSQKGVYRKYSLTYSDENTTTLFPDRLGKKNTNPSTFMSSFSFDGDLIIADYGKLKDDKIVSLSFDKIRKNSFAMNGHDFFNDPAVFMKKYKNNEVYMKLNNMNEILSFHFPGETPQVFKKFMTTIAQEIQISIKEGRSSWTGMETNQHGKGLVNYNLTGKKDGNFTLEKTRKNYINPGFIAPDDKQAINLTSKITLDPKGALQKIDTHERSKIQSQNKNETILDVNKRLQLDFIEKGNFNPNLMNSEFLGLMKKVLPGESIPDEGVDKELLAKRAGYLSYDEIEHWIKTFKPNEKNNRANNAMFYRTTGFVELHPESTKKLADYCKNKAKTSQERILAMNILAAVATQSAQQAMRDILSDSRIRKDKRQSGIMIQNFSFMEKKAESETLDFLMDLTINEKGFISYSAAHAFGSCINRLYTGDEKKRALELNTVLVKKMTTAQTIKDKKEYVAALGNAGIVENNQLIFDLFSSKSPDIRSEAVMAIRKTETPEARHRLLTLFPDPVRAVQRSSIQTYLQYSPSEANLNQIKKYLNESLVEEANFYDMVTLLKKNGSSHPDLTQDCLKLMVRKKLHDPDLEARIRSLIK